MIRRKNRNKIGGGDDSGERDGGNVAPTLPHPSPHHLPATPHVTPTT